MFEAEVAFAVLPFAVWLFAIWPFAIWPLAVCPFAVRLFLVLLFALLPLPVVFICLPPILQLHLLTLLFLNNNTHCPLSTKGVRGPPCRQCSKLMSKCEAV